MSAKFEKVYVKVQKYSMFTSIMISSTIFVCFC